MIKVFTCDLWNSSVENRILKAASDKTVGVGIPSDSKYPDGQEIESVAFTQEFGNGNVPPRPFVRNAIAEKKSEWAEEAAKNLKDIVNGDQGASVERVGEKIKADIVKSIDDTIAPPLAEVTVKTKRKKGRRNPAKPLIDSGLLRDSFKVEAK